ncbi:hypothetical protein AOLI_G00244500 [Acnodon oligacanthus]
MVTGGARRHERAAAKSGRMKVQQRSSRPRRRIQPPQGPRQSYHIISSRDRLSINTRPSSADWVSSLEIDGGLRDDASRFQVLPASANRAAGDTDAAPSRTLFLLRVWRLKAPEPRRTRRPADQQTGLFGAGRQLRFSTSQKRRRQLRFTPLTPLRSCSAVLALLGSQISIIPQATSECSTAKVALS